MGADYTGLIVGVVGAGTMGAGIAQVAASAGHKTILFDTNTEMLEKASSNLKRTLSSLVEKGKLSEEKAKGIQGNIAYASSLIDFSNCGLIIEAIVENADVKQRLFKELEGIVGSSCILASNTSSLSITSIASACVRPERVAGIHFFNPAPLMPLVEVIPGLMTTPDMLQLVNEIVTSWGKVTVVAKDTPGFIVNRVARPFYGEAIRIYEEGIADFATIDWALKTMGGFRMGPFELMDFIGNDINYKVTETVWEQFFYEARFKPSFTQKRLYEARLFGRKSGKGYYDYAPGAGMPDPLKDEQLARLIADRVLVMLINEAIDAYYLKLASLEHLELAMTKGVNYPKGLLKWGNEMGLDKVLSLLQGLYELYQEDRYRPSVLLKTMVKEGREFPILN